MEESLRARKERRLEQQTRDVKGAEKAQGQGRACEDEGSENWTWTQWMSRTWSHILIPITLVIVPCTDLVWLCHVPNWCLCNPPERNDSDSRTPPGIRAEGGSAKLLPANASCSSSEESHHASPQPDSTNDSAAPREEAP